MDSIIVTGRHRDFFLASALLTTLLVILGGVVCLTDSSRGCPDWPACYGRLLPPPRLDSILEYTHRVVAAGASLLIFASAIVGRRKYRSIRWLSRPPAVALGFLSAVIIFGAMVVLRGLEPGLAALDLGSALLVQALVVTAAVVAAVRRKNADQPDRISLNGTLAKLALSALVATWAVLVSGVLVAEADSAVRCLGWPPYGGRLDLGDARGWLQAARGLAGGLAGILIVSVVALAWRAQPGQGATRCVATLLAVLLAAEILVGALLVVVSPVILLQVVYVALAAALWASLVALAVLAGLEASAARQRACPSR